MQCETANSPKESVIVEAPGKIILHGEHAVVYGNKAIACAIDGNITIELKKSCDNGLFVSMDNLSSTVLVKKDNLQDLYHQLVTSDRPNLENFSFQNQVRSYIESHGFTTNTLMQVAVSACVFGYLKVLAFEKKLLPSLVISATSANLPIGAGLGSSAAFNVALSTALLVFVGTISPADVNAKTKHALNTINELAFTLEQLVHGTPSGIDNTVSTYGGAIVYKNKEIKTLPSFENLSLLIVDTGISRNTKELVLKVREKYNKENKLMLELLEEFETICDESELILSNSNNTFTVVQFDSLKKLINRNQEILHKIGVSHPCLDQITQLSVSLGFACKLTGAGGGGCAFILLDVKTPAKITELKLELARMGFKNWEVKLGGAGVRILQHNGVKF